MSRKVCGETLEWVNASVEGDRALARWDSRLHGKAVGTRYLYLRYLRVLCARFGLTPQGLYDLRLQEMQSTDPLEKGMVRDKTIQIMREMEEGRYEDWPETARALLISRNQMKELQPRAPSTCKQLAKAVTSFFETFDMEFKVKAKDKPQGSSNGQYGLSQAHLLEAVKHGGRENPYRNVAVFMFLKDAGVRRGDLEGFKVRDYLDAVEVRGVAPGERFKVFKEKSTEKEGVVAGIRVGPETVEAVDKYLEVERPGCRPDEPLFMERDKRYGYEGPISGGAAGLIVKRMIRLGLGPEAYKRSAHSLRKFHKTRLEAGGVPEQWVKMLQGKASDVYSKPEPRELTDKYVEAYDQLRVYPVHEDFEQLRRELKEAHKLKNETVSELELRLAEQQRTIEAMQKSLEAINRRDAERREWEKLRESPPER